MSHVEVIALNECGLGGWVGGWIVWRDGDIGQVHTSLQTCCENRENSTKCEIEVLVKAGQFLIRLHQRLCNSSSPAHKRWAFASDWTAPSACTRLCAGLSCSQSAGSACWDRSPGFRFSTAETNTKDGNPRGDSRLHGGSRDSQKKCCHLLQAAIHSVGATDVKAEQDGIRVAVAQWPHVVIVGGTLRRQNVEKNSKTIGMCLKVWHCGRNAVLFNCLSPQIFN